MATLEELVVKLTLENDSLKRKMRESVDATKKGAGEMDRAFAGFKNQIKQLIPAVTLVGLVAFTNHAINAGDALNDMSKRSGVAVETLSKLDLYAKQTGTSIEGVADGLKFMSRNLGEAAGGNKAAAQSFTQLGLSVSQLRGLSPEEQFLAIADRISQLGDASDRTKAAMDIFGRSGANLIPIMEGGADAIRKAMDQAERLGLVLSADEVARMDEFNDKWEEMNKRLTRLAQEGFVFLYDAASAAREQLALLAGEFNRVNELALRGEMATMKGKIAQSNARLSDLRSGSGWVVDPLGLGFQTRDQAIQSETARKQHMLDRMADMQTALAPFNTPALSAGAGTKGRGLGRTLAPAPVEAKDVQLMEEAEDALGDYIRKLEMEHDLLQLTGKDREAMEAVYEAQNAAMRDGTLLTDEQIAKIKGLAAANHELKDSMEEARRFAKELHDQLSKGLADAILDFDSATDSAKNFAKAIANTVLQKQVTGPLADGIINSLSGSSLFSGLGNLFGFGKAGGGKVQAGTLYPVNERGIELFRPDTSGTIVPNGARNGGASGVTVVNHWNISPGVQGTVRQELIAMMPAIEARTTAGVMNAIEQGGSVARIVGRRS